MLENTEYKDEIEGLVAKREVGDAARDMIASIPGHVDSHQLVALWEHIVDEATCSSTDVEDPLRRPPRELADRLLDELCAQVVIPASTTSLQLLTRGGFDSLPSRPHGP